MQRMGAGFTLLELLVALAVFAIMGAAAYSGLDSVLQTRAAIAAESDRLSELQMAFALLERDIEQAVARPIRDDFGQQQAALIGDSTGSVLLRFTRAGWDNPLRQARANLQRLDYRLEDSQLSRGFWGSLDRGDASAMQSTVLLRDVDTVRMRFLDDADRWQTDWPVRGDTPLVLLPRAVEVTLVLADWGEVTRLFRVIDG